MFINIHGTRINTDNILGYRNIVTDKGRYGIQILTADEKVLDLPMDSCTQAETGILLTYIDKALNVVKFLG